MTINHRFIEIVLLTVSEYYGIDWRVLYRYRKGGGAKVPNYEKAWTVIIVYLNQHTKYPHEFLGVSDKSFYKHRAKPLPDEYNEISQLIYSKLDKAGITLEHAA